MSSNRSSPAPARNTRRRRKVVAVAVSAALLGTSAATILADQMGVFTWSGADAATSEAGATGTGSVNEIFLSEIDIHPNRLYGDFITLRPRIPDSHATAVIRDFQTLLALYEVRQGRDDNFTMRAIDNRTGGLLELVQLEQLRTQHADSNLSWSHVDRVRRSETEALVKKHIEAGTPREFVTVKWGRRDQIAEAWTRKAKIVEHEVEFARFLKLSLLSSEIGTVETFNDDRAVSRVGARSRYQILPSMLREMGVRHYTLTTGTGRVVTVTEEWHPLIAMQAAFVVVKAYSNAMGHELPGLSAYHTGPFNVLRLYRNYLTIEHENLGPYSNVATAFMWALTAGYDIVSDRSTFGPQSRGYVPSLYGALIATEDLAIDTTQTLLVERVQLRKNESIYLGDLLTALEPLVDAPAWRTSARDTTSYLRFRRINPHIDLPPSVLDENVPTQGDVYLVASAQRAPVRFFLPIGSSQKLAQAGWDIFDHEKTFRFERNAYRSDPTPADAEYDALVEETYRFGLSESGRSKLERLYRQFSDMRRSDPSFYRQTQYDVIRLHRRVWRSKNFQAVIASAEAARSRLDVPPLPPIPLIEPLDRRPVTSVPMSR